jgi:hypothetical protein
MLPASYKKNVPKEPTLNPEIALPEMNNSSIEDKIFSPDNVRFMLQLRSSINTHANRLSPKAAVQEEPADSQLNKSHNIIPNPPSFYN